MAHRVQRHGIWKHRLLPAKGQHYPSRVVCVDCDGGLKPAGDGARRNVETLHRWSAVATYYKAGQPCREVGHVGHDSHSWWEWLTGLLHKKTRTWLVCSPSGRTLSLLGFWKGLEDGTITLAGSGVRHTDRGTVRVQVLRDVCSGPGGERGVPQLQQVRHDRGRACIVDDPPTVISCTVRGAAGSLLIVDARNWGFEDSQWEGKADERCKAMAATVAGIVQTLRIHQLGSLRTTAGAQALHSLRSCDGDTGIFVHRHANALRLERDGYHGGRSECFHIGPVPGPCYLLDIKSCYPWCASEHDLPRLLSDYAEGAGAQHLLARAGGARCIADVSIETHSGDYPVLCHLRTDRVARPLHYWTDRARREFPGMVAYPRGIYRTVLCGPELVDCLEAGRVTTVHRVSAYVMGRPLSRFYATWRDACDSAAEHGRHDILRWLKRLGVALIGKFGQLNRRWVEHGPRSEPELYTSGARRSSAGVWQRYRVVAGHCFREVVGGESFDSCPGLAAWVCSLGRRRLLQMLRCAGREHVYMVLTDCLLVDAEGRNNLDAMGFVRNNEWGYLKDSAPFERACVYGYNHYQLGDTVKCSGLPRGQVIDNGDGRSYRFLPSVAGQLRSGNRPDALAEYHEYARRQPYLHGRVRADGMVEPWEFI